MRTLEVTAIATLKDNKLDEMGIDAEVEEKRIRMEFKAKEIACIGEDTDYPDQRTLVMIKGGVEYTVDMPYDNFRELWHSAKQKEPIV